MIKIGLKLWSTNAENYLEPARMLYAQGVFDYIELYIVPGTLNRLAAWKSLDIPFILHNAHFAHGFNLAKRECEAENRKIYEETARYADALKAPHIIFHGGVDGSAEETGRQLARLREPRALLENKPYVALPNKMGGSRCRGAVREEVALIRHETGCGFCLDFGHAVCAANSLHVDPYAYIDGFREFGPAMYHLSDIKDMKSPYDAHPHLGTGSLDVYRILKHTPVHAALSLETEKNSIDNLDDFRADTRILRHTENVVRGGASRKLP